MDGDEKNRETTSQNEVETMNIHKISMCCNIKNMSKYFISEDEYSE